MLKVGTLCFEAGHAQTVRQRGFFGTRQFYFQNVLVNRRFAFDDCAFVVGVCVAGQVLHRPEPPWANVSEDIAAIRISAMTAFVIFVVILIAYL
jgi:hypothetical protein